MVYILVLNNYKLIQFVLYSTLNNHYISNCLLGIVQPPLQQGNIQIAPHIFIPDIPAGSSLVIHVRYRDGLNSSNTKQKLSHIITTR